MSREAFIKWACQYSGGDGGDIRGAVWILGIEHGAPKGRKEGFAFTPAEEIPQWPEEREPFLRHLNQYNSKAAKLLAVMEGRPLADYKEFAWERRLFRAGSGYFKWNLFPLPFKSVSPAEWDAVWTGRTGFASKAEYMQWCREHRFPQIRTWFDRHQPELVISNGITVRTDYALALGLDPDGFHLHEIDKGLPVYTQGRLVVVPFFGRPLNSHEKIRRVGEYLSQYRSSLTSR